MKTQRISYYNEDGDFMAAIKRSGKPNHFKEITTLNTLVKK